MANIEPFFFGPDKKIFGIYHGPTVTPRRCTVLIVPPLLNEYMRSHAALRKMAWKLAQSGFDVFRFDFRGTGNSGGQFETLDLCDLLSDLQSARQESLEITGNTRISAVGVRFSAHLIAESSREDPYRSVAMWDPIFDGNAWLQKVMSIENSNPNSTLSPQPVDCREIMGSKLGGGLFAQIQNAKSTKLDADRTLFIRTEPSSSDYPVFAIKPETMHLQFECRWEKMTSQVLYPHSVIEHICKAIN